jgi:hypothetical protein
LQSCVVISTQDLKSALKAHDPLHRGITLVQQLLRNPLSILYVATHHHGVDGPEKGVKTAELARQAVFEVLAR